MAIRKRAFIRSFILVAALLLPPVTLAQGGPTSTGDWSALNTVSMGSKLEVKLKDGKSLKGKLSGVSDTNLSLTVNDKAVDIKREDISTVHQTSAKSATKATLIGLGVGAGAGAAIGVAGSNSSSDSFDKLDHAVTAGLTVIGAGVGAVTGYLIGRSGRKRVLIYQSQP